MMKYTSQEVLKDLAVSLFIAAAIVFLYAGFGALLNKIVAPELVLNIALGFLVLAIVYFVLSVLVKEDYTLLAVIPSILLVLIGIGLFQVFLPLIIVGDIVMKVVWIFVISILLLVGLLEILQYFGIVKGKLVGF